MDAWLKIRVYQADLDQWQRYAGYRGMSRFVRDACNAELRRRKMDAQHKAPPPQEPVARVQPPPRLMNEPRASRKQPLPECRHGLVNCRVCGTGHYAKPEYTRDMYEQDKRARER